MKPNKYRVTFSDGTVHTVADCVHAVSSWTEAVIVAAGQRIANGERADITKTEVQLQDGEWAPTSDGARIVVVPE